MPALLLAILQLAFALFAVLGATLVFVILWAWLEARGAEASEPDWHDYECREEGCDLLVTCSDWDIVQTIGYEHEVWVHGKADPLRRDEIIAGITDYRRRNGL